MHYLVIGTSFVDIKGFPEGNFLLEGRNAGSIQYVHGGVGRNIASNLARCGCDVVFASAVDESPFSAAVVDSLKAEQVNTDHIIVSKDGLGTWLAVFDSQGDVAASLSKRPDMTGLIPEMDRHGRTLFGEADSILLEIDMEKEVVEKVFDWADRYGLPVYAVISNMEYALRLNAFAHPVDCLVCNLQEAGMLLSADLKDASPEEVIRQARDHIGAYNIARIIVTMGETGAVYYDKKTGEAGHEPARSVEVCDTTGAGDAFFSGAAMELVRGRSLRDACQTGVLLASAVITTRENVCPRGVLEGR